MQEQDMKKLITLTALLLTTTSFANIGGQWSGWGDWTYQGMGGSHCYSMKMNLEETDSLLVRHGGQFECEMISLSLSPAQWVKRGNNLLVDDKIVGTITDKRMHVEEEFSDSVKVVTDITYEGNHMDYSETWYNDDMLMIYEITGRFFRKGVAND